MDEIPAHAENYPKGIIYGTKGFIIVENITNFESRTVYDLNRREIKHIDCPPQISGYEYEVEACVSALEEGRLECPPICLMPKPSV